MKKIFLIIVITVISSCALIVDGRKQSVSFESNENDVDIFVNGKFACKTPCMTEIKRGNKQVMITAKKVGFDNKTIFLSRGFNSTSALNIISIWTSTFGFTTDIASSAIWEYMPNSIYIALLPNPKTATQKKIHVKQNKIREFILRNYEMLQSDAYSQENSSFEYLKALSNISDIPIEELQTIILSSYSAADTTEKVVGSAISSKSN